MNKHKFFKLFIDYSLLYSIVLILSCNSAKWGWKTIELGRYEMDVPKDFKFKIQQGIDSQVGIIVGSKLKLFTFFGYYTDTLYQTPQEYLSKKDFIYDAASKFMKPSVTYDDRNYPRIEVLSIRPSTVKDSDKIHFFGGSDYVATCRHEKETFTWAVRLPEKVKNHTVKIDTFNHMYRRIATPKKGYQGETAVYMRDKRSFNASVNNYYGIAIGADSLTNKQQKLALEIFSTLRQKNKVQ